MKALWIDEGHDPDYARIARWFPPFAAPRCFLYFAERIPWLTPAYLDAVRRYGYDVGIYWASTWDPNLTGAEWAQHLNERWLELGGADKLLAVQANIEQHDPERIAAFLSTWRALRPFAVTSLAIEGFQGGGPRSWFAALRDQIVKAHVLVVAEAYGDLPGAPMSPYDSDGVVRDLLDAGFPRDSIAVFHHGTELRRGWAGFVFTQQELPA